ncbi:MAG TPA: NADH:flavin oxidoreductase/NADH oxidase [Povalibacter sp.]|uniref:NADH:flavin oxidoreductase/NADH oxidase n=1 Tax=Povalibacter sp. TaxID=1962978 RepID=UPI002B6C4D07|nr:NADH:flavin oxidoreductase/NADH oxidase [Povalibacter sp.]HMN46815.1 NADH:flavin oxidoreductase/NADH oxidase [Povalibacter sp.]
MASRLFESARIGSVEIPNRIVVAPMCQYSANDGSATDWHLQHLSQLAYSGAGLVMVEATAVERRGRITHGCLGLYSDDNEAALARAIAAARRLAGPTKFGIQIAHAGRKASSRRPWEDGSALAANEDPWLTVSSSAAPYGEGWHVPQALGVDDIDATIAAFVQAAQRAVRIGFEVIEIHSAHGYLLHQFLSPLANARTDRYGGSLDNRMRLPLAVIAAVRAAVPASVAVGLRVSATDWVDGGWDLPRTIAYVREAKQPGIDYVCVSSGGIRAGVKVPVAPEYQVEFAQEVKTSTGVPTRAVGLITDPHQAERILAEGRADMIALARAFLDDPRWGWRAADALGARAHFPPPYSMARGAGWRRFRDEIAVANG